MDPRRDHLIDVPPALRLYMRIGEESRRVRSLGGLVGFALAFYAGWHATGDKVIALQYAIAGAIVGYLAVWTLLLIVASSVRKDAVHDLRTSLDRHIQEQSERR